MGGDFGRVRGSDRQPWPTAADRPGSGARSPARAARTPTARHGGLVVLAACIGFWLVTSGSREPVGPPLPSPAEALSAAGAVGPGIAPLPGSPPGRIRIPSIRVDAPLTGLGLARDGSLEVPPPDRPDLAGWYREGVTPGATGTAVIAGHVDDSAGPGVFYDLGALRRGAAIEIPRADGRTAVFTVHAVEVYDAKAFPDTRVYGPSTQAELRVITCGGGFSPRTGYRGNVVVFAHLTGTY
ncbi:class F sortase [Streptomyces sp. NBC_01294]|uniref:class F sortase n=1 Tax=Streptomyces sp. NBC_01294 TaxID=2903815 RepID=UPI002DD8F3CB|nr:class F sortase [Streptomyces sp. NBC_01294]WRZ59486.1 class F sortase [Streptomyces sp. NBC_01294]